MSDGIHVRAKVEDLRRRSVSTWCQCFDGAAVEFQLQICHIFLDLYRIRWLENSSTIQLCGIILWVMKRKMWPLQIS